MTPQQRAKAAQRVLVIAANSELQERGLLKHARIARSINAALRERGVDELTARLGAEVGCSPAQSPLSTGWSRTLTNRSRSML